MVLMKRVLFRASSSTSSFANGVELDSDVNAGSPFREMVWLSESDRLYAITRAYGACGYEAAMNCFPWPKVQNSYSKAMLAPIT